MTFRDFLEVHVTALELWTLIQWLKMTVSVWGLYHPLCFGAGNGTFVK